MSVASKPSSGYQLQQRDDYWAIAFSAMASPCEILVRCAARSEAEQLASLAHSEALRIERKFSRYRNDNVVHAINNSHGRAVEIDGETLTLLKYAANCYELSDGLFDITSGVLRRAWKFDGQEIRPDGSLIAAIMLLVGWDKVRLTDHDIRMRPEMEIDLGGLGKEYAVDRVCQMLFAASGASVMVNFGGDIRAATATDDRQTWRIGIEDTDNGGLSIGRIELKNGAVTTSGCAYRYCVVDGKRLSHILNPKTGWPIDNAPLSVTVVAELCTEAGFLSTLAMLHGSEAEDFLRAQDARFHCVR